MRRAKCYLWTLLILASVILIASSISGELSSVILIKVFGFLSMILGGWKLRKYRDIMDSDIDKLESLMDVQDDEYED